MKRAYVLVLREKQREILPAVQKHVTYFESLQNKDDEDYTPGTKNDLRLKLENEFGIGLHPDHLDGSLSAEYLSGPIAASLLAQNPPEDMIPPQTQVTYEEMVDHVTILMSAAVMLKAPRLGVDRVFSGSASTDVDVMIAKIVSSGAKLTDQFEAEIEKARDQAHQNFPYLPDLVEEAMEKVEAQVFEAYSRARQGVVHTKPVT